jgi:primosomal protein N' (replication factor Y)
MLAAEVAVEHTVYHFDKGFDYRIPTPLVAQAQPGCRVLVPFGSGDRKRQGMLLSLHEVPEQTNLKSLQAVLDAAPLLSHEALLMVPWMKTHYFCTLYDAVRLLLPVGITYRMQAFYRLTKAVDEAFLHTLPQEVQEVVRYVETHSGVAQRDLWKALALPEDSPIVEMLCRRGILTYEVNPVRRMQDASMRMVRLCDPLPDTYKLTARQKEVFQVLQDVGCASVKELCYFTGVTPVVIKNMATHGICELYEQEVYRTPFRENQKAQASQTPIHLSDDQARAFAYLSDLCRQPQVQTALLYGVTGSGKTSVYLCLIDQVYKAGKGVLFMVPEISLTPQMVEIFRRRYGEAVALFHSGLSMGERMDEWKRVQRGEAKIVVGTRSAVFAPLQSIGLIILDEEQESSYQSEQGPRYHAAEVASFRARYHKALLLLASATPRVETYYAAQQGRIRFAELPKRYGGALLPEVQICDMNEEFHRGNLSILSAQLLKALQENLNCGQQSILLLNRRGYQTFVSCRDCGHVMTCPQCSISLTYHAANRRLMCHYCGYSIPFTDECPACHGHHMQYAGTGTQKAEQQLAELLPGARILRLDTDATMSRLSYETKLHQFAQREYDIIVGTQMVAKGLDFENVTLVGVLNADQSLYQEDFRSFEQTFDLLTQVVGRAGRGRFTGRAFIQTQTPENPVFHLAARQDYPAFYAAELPARQMMLYPPFADICVVGFVGIQEQDVANASQRFFEQTTALARAEYTRLPLRILRPSPARIARVGGKYRYKILIKCRNGRAFRQMLDRLLVAFGQDRKNRGVSAFADINPDAVW